MTFSWQNNLTQLKEFQVYHITFNQYCLRVLCKNIRQQMNLMASKQILSVLYEHYHFLLVITQESNGLDPTTSPLHCSYMERRYHLS